MNRARLCKLYGSLLVVACFFLFFATAAHGVDRKDVIDRAHRSYYSLRGLGLLEFKSSITPAWEVTLKNDLNTDPAGAQAGIKMLDTLHFAMTLDENGKVKVDHRADTPPPNEKAAAAFNQIYSGMDQAVSGFFETWSMFMLTSPFPEANSDYQLEDLGSEYRLSYKEGSANIVTSMNKD